MHRHAHGEHDGEGGNAVALTLLSLAVMIVAGVAVLYITGKGPQPLPAASRASVVATSTETTDNPQADWKTYESLEYTFSMRYPPGWLVATGTVDEKPVVTLAPGVLNASSSTMYHVAATRVSVYPRGLPASLVFQDEDAQSSVIVPVPRAAARDFVLESKRPWATVVRFDIVPDTWDASGVVFGRAAVEDESVRYRRGDGDVEEDSYDPTKGDRIVRAGFVDPILRETVEGVLRSFSFLTNNEGRVSDVGEGASADILVDEPQQDTVLVSPVTVRGKARGSWYFEASFPITVRAADGTILTTVPAQAAGDWMTDAYVPFEVSIAFDPGTATSGSLVFTRDNPSGIRAQEVTHTIPVRFATSS